MFNQPPDEPGDTHVTPVPSEVPYFTGIECFTYAMHFNATLVAAHPAVLALLPCPECGAQWETEWDDEAFHSHITHHDGCQFTVWCQVFDAVLDRARVKAEG